jgi:hypothetical protein
MARIFLAVPKANSYVTTQIDIRLVLATFSGQHFENGWLLTLSD